MTHLWVDWDGRVPFPVFLAFLFALSIAPHAVWVCRARGALWLWAAWASAAVLVLSGYNYFAVYFVDKAVPGELWWRTTFIWWHALVPVVFTAALVHVLTRWRAHVLISVPGAVFCFFALLTFGLGSGPF